MNEKTQFDLATVDKLLTTTRAVRKRLDLQRPVSLDVVKECLELALQAPSGANAQSWRWLVVTDPERRRRLAELYRNPKPHARPSSEPVVTQSDQERRVRDSVMHLMEHMGEVPVLVVPCILNAGGAAGWAPSMYPAVWSFMLALRSRGLGSVITTAHLFRAAEAAEVLEIPDGYVQSCLLPVAYYTGEDFRPAERRPVAEVCFHDRWGNALA